MRKFPSLFYVIKSLLQPELDHRLMASSKTIPIHYRCIGCHLMFEELAELLLEWGCRPLP